MSNYQPNTISSGYGQTKVCSRCGVEKSLDRFAKVKNFFFPEGTVHICSDCINEHLALHDWNWEVVDQLCRMANIPFVPEKWEEIKKMDSGETFNVYADIFMAEEFDNLDWSDYYKEFKRLEEVGLIDKELPNLKEKRIKKLRAIFGGDVEPDDLDYLENLLNGFKTTRNVNGVIDTNHAVKLCRISLQMDSEIRAGNDIQKLVAAYDKLMQTAGFTAKDAKNINDFDSVGEIFAWYEKRGWKNPYYDGETRDVVDGTMKSIQNFGQRLYTQESGIGEEITQRIQNLQAAQQMEENAYGDFEYNIEQYDNETYEDLMGKQEFVADLDGEE